MVVMRVYQPKERMYSGCPCKKLHPTEKLRGIEGGMSWQGGESIVFGFDDGVLCIYSADRC